MRKQDLIRLVTYAALAAVPMMIPTIAAGQAPVLPAAAPAQLPNGPAKPRFDITRFSANGGIFKTFYVQQPEPLQKALEEGRVAGDTPVLVTETATGKLALLTDQMVFHHLAEGQAGGKDWMATF